MLSTVSPLEHSLNGSGSARRADQIYSYLRKEILKGNILSRTRLIENDLAKLFNVSRTPVREAISRLVQEQLVVPLSTGGVEVIDIIKELEEIYLILEALEGVAVRLAAENITEEEINSLEALLEDSQSIDILDYESRIKSNKKFHQIIYHASRSTRLINLISSYRDFSLNKKILMNYTKRDTIKAIKQHHEIVEALKARDGTKAERLVRSHLRHFKGKDLKK